MTNEGQQRKKAASIKEEIRRNAAYRREKTNGSSSTAPRFDVISDIAVSKASSTESPTPITSQSPAPATSVTSTIPDPLEQQAFFFSSMGFNEHHQMPSTGPVGSSTVEANFIGKYLGFVFPAMFPFYRPTLFETGSSWLLHLLWKRQPARHAAVGLSCYIFTQALTDVRARGDNTGDFADCRAARWEEVNAHTDRCFQSLRTELSALDKHTKLANMNRVELFECVIQALVLEMGIGKANPLRSHLAPAFGLFHDIMNPNYHCANESPQLKLVGVLLNIEEPLWTSPNSGSRIWSPTQTGFRFCAAYLAFVDVIASTALQTPPKLLSYHDTILTQTDNGIYNVTEVQVQLSGIIGVRNWVIRSIAATSALDAWKQASIKDHSLSVMELENRASYIASELKANISKLEDDLYKTPTAPAGLRAPFDSSPNPAASSTPSLVWANTAHLYLMVVVLGWQVSNLDIRATVARVIALLHNIPSYQFRAFAWPVCVAGCLALENEEDTIRAIFQKLGKVDTVGALDDARQIMEEVWRRRETLDAKTWDLAACFAAFGEPIMLV